MLRAVLARVADKLPHGQFPAVHAEKAQALALRVARYFIHPRGEPVPRCCRYRVLVDRLHEFFDALGAKTGAEEAREHMPGLYQLRDRIAAQLPAAQIFVHRGLAAHGKPLIERGGVFPEVHALRVEPPLQIGHQRGLVADEQVHFGHEYEGRYPVAPQQLPQRLRVRLHTVRPADDENRIIQHAQAALRLGDEIDVPRRIQKRNAALRQVDHRLL